MHQINFNFWHYSRTFSTLTLSLGIDRINNCFRLWIFVQLEIKICDRNQCSKLNFLLRTHTVRAHGYLCTFRLQTEIDQKSCSELWFDIRVCLFVWKTTFSSASIEIFDTKLKSNYVKSFKGLDIKRWFWFVGIRPMPTNRFILPSFI